jgi:hypothetical protein
MSNLGAPAGQKSGLRRSFFVLLVLILSSAFCIGLSAAAMAQETDTATTAHEEEPQVESTPTGQPTDWHPEEEEEAPGCNVEEEPHAEPAAEDECDAEEEPEEPAEEDSDDESDDDSDDESDDDDECEIPGENDGGDDRADDDEDDTDCEAEKPEAEEPEEEGDDTEVLGTTTVRPRLAQTGPENATLALYGIAFLTAGIVTRGAGTRFRPLTSDELVAQALRRNERYLARHR